MRVSAAVSAAASLRAFSEPLLAKAARPLDSANAVHIDSNENPLGPSAAARAAAVSIVAQGGRYNDQVTESFEELYAAQNGLKRDYVRAYPGSSSPLCYSVVAFTSAKKSYVTADPGYEAGFFTADAIGTRIVRVPLTKTYSHDVKSMIEQAPDAGLFYVCTPNNPTGTLTSHSDVEYLLENKPKGSIVLVDEAYIHFSDAQSCFDLVKADKDIVVLRTFSKLYGMAGLRCGVAVARPDLLKRIATYGGWNAMPITAVAAASASLKEPQLVSERKRINAEIRTRTFEWLDKNGFTYVPSDANFFMLDMRRPAEQIIQAMARSNVMIGRVWPAMPNWSRITVGTQQEMDQFQAAFQRTMSGNAVGWSLPEVKSGRQSLDGFIVS
jgi:histidinol-phosphate aminotransferase